jgi:flavin reductase
VSEPLVSARIATAPPSTVLRAVPALAVDPGEFLDAMSAAVTGVTVVTTNGAAGRLGLTVGTMVSVSAEPPLLLVSIRRSAPLLRALLANGVFGVSVLSASQANVADTFAGRPGPVPPYDFGVAAWEAGASGVPLLQDAAARFECEVARRIDAGTHTLVLGSVTVADQTDSPPLAYTARRYAEPRVLAS